MKRLPAIGITCYPSQGGSGIVATELGLNLARSGYAVHFICASLPLRLRQYQKNVFYHEVEVADYPVFQYPPYTLSLATAMAETAQKHALDILHVHYAIPHAASGYLARQMVGGDRLKLITTLHGTDITLVGQEPAFFPITRFLIEQSDAVTAVSGFLARETRKVFGVDRSIEVIPNFVDTRRFRPVERSHARRRFAADGEALIIHASNFRPVKNLPAVLEVFARVAARRPARLLLLGDGPQREPALAQARALGVAERVAAPGLVEDLDALLPLGDLLLLPSHHESFGLVALEAMSCGVPVIATSRGGTDEFIDDGVNGYLRDPDDVAGMAEVALLVLGDPALHRHLAEEARRDAVASFGARCVLQRYVELYDRVLGGGGGPAGPAGPAS
ncbi:MAG TPA: N-acetyl-alpha-D-glucosaminyl L-malate synthase BshA [Candidatus Krumholzibacteria bacterium]|nr:N-acetyl-alpha-D-glucosaminyl L-malate synthase BshA [Candidatus Krumholzibacteria bacterium]HPD71686.1 N-acetyl-alpha-D-glucosaminyl L-malate synthase BshA [Candidatus Krumholzibacteria bacterium]HRY41381.1 N-acetyl-alpha-D-glucosaminyl L-malate synthase BshA [Candidatus Krumholzibacteria bacterium]